MPTAGAAAPLLPGLPVVVGLEVLEEPPVVWVPLVLIAVVIPLETLLLLAVPEVEDEAEPVEVPVLAPVVVPVAEVVADDVPVEDVMPVAEVDEAPEELGIPETLPPQRAAAAARACFCSSGVHFERQSDEAARILAWLSVLQAHWISVRAQSVVASAGARHPS